MKQPSGTLSAPLRVILVLCTALIVLLSNLYAVASPAFIRREYGKLTFPSADLYSDAERLVLAEATLHYMRSDEDETYLSNLQSQQQSVYKAREISHLLDAKRVLNWALGLHAVASVLVIAVGVYSWRQPNRRAVVLRFIGQGCLICFVLVMGVAILAYAAFDPFFVAFHRIFFQGDSWLFSYSDTLIQLFPVQFWIDATWGLALLSLAEAAVLGRLAYFLSRRLEPAR